MHKKMILLFAILALLITGCGGTRITQKNSNGSKAVYYLDRESRRHGKYTSWYPGGQVCTKGMFAYGKAQGKWQMWDKGGKRIKVKTYNNGLEMDTVTKSIPISEFLIIPK